MLFEDDVSHSLGSQQLPCSFQNREFVPLDIDLHYAHLLGWVQHGVQRHTLDRFGSSHRVIEF